MQLKEQSSTQILIVDDVPANLRVLRDALEPEGYSILGASEGKAALRIAAATIPDLIMLDVLMPGMDGYEVCRQLKTAAETRDIPVVFVTMRDDKEGILQGFRTGAVDYITKPFERKEIVARVQAHLQIRNLTRRLAERNQELEARTADLTRANAELQRTNAALRQEVERREQAENAFQTADGHLSVLTQQEASRWGISGFVGQSKTIAKILADVRKLQHVQHTSVLISGESGTGKELIARAIHFGGLRSKGPFIPVNCSTIPRELAESMFFGHVRGAFTGATTDHRGYFEIASGGTLFLDEIGDLPLELQPKLLRVLETGTVQPVGSSSEKHVDGRILAATNQNLQSAIQAGRFRADLYFRLARFTVHVPPLRERAEDIPLLANHFLGMFSAEMGIRGAHLSAEAHSALAMYSFPGNVRELKNILEHALICSDGVTIQPEHLCFIAADPLSGSLPNPRPLTANSDRYLDHKQLTELVVKRSQETRDSDGLATEEKILAYIRTYGSINNSECRDLLSVDLQQAYHLLRKLCSYGLLRREGERRWARYHLS